VSGTVLKGGHTARHCFEEPGVRPMADLDVYVGSALMAVAEGALAAAGFEEVAGGRLARPRRSGWRLPGAPVGVRSLLLVHADDGYVIDLHGTLDIDFFGVRTVAFGEPGAAQLTPAWRGGDSAAERSRPEAARPDQQAPLPGLPEGTSVLAEPLLAAHCAVHAGHGLHGLTLIRLVELALAAASRPAFTRRVVRAGRPAPVTARGGLCLPCLRTCREAGSRLAALVLSSFVRPRRAAAVAPPRRLAHTGGSAAAG
jgi:hypothetical protein